MGRLVVFVVAVVDRLFAFEFVVLTKDKDKDKRVRLLLLCSTGSTVSTYNLEWYVTV
jgi:hypothetical protein